LNIANAALTKPAPTQHWITTPSFICGFLKTTDRSSSQNPIADSCFSNDNNDANVFAIADDAMTI
jgi:hypothetical protein